MSSLDTFWGNVSCSLVVVSSNGNGRPKFPDWPAYWHKLAHYNTKIIIFELKFDIFSPQRWIIVIEMREYFRGIFYFNFETWLNTSGCWILLHSPFLATLPESNIVGVCLAHKQYITAQMSKRTEWTTPAPCVVEICPTFFLAKRHLINYYWTNIWKIKREKWLNEWKS